MTSHEFPSNNDITPSSEKIDFDNDLSPDEEMQEFIQRMEQANAATETHKDELLKLYAYKQFDKMNAKIDELADATAGNSPEFTANIKRLRTLRSYRNPNASIKDEITQITARQNELYAYYRGSIINETGLPDDAHFSEIEKARNTIGQILADTYHDEPYTATEALSTLGIRTVEDDKVTLRFPEELVPESTHDLWQGYLATVCDHVRVEAELKNKSATSDQSTVMQADRTRTFAHNAITREMHAILNLQPSHAWDEKDTRKVLANIRDQVLFSKEVALTKSKELSANQIASLEVVKQLSSRSHS